MSSKQKLFAFLKFKGYNCAEHCSTGTKFKFDLHIFMAHPYTKFQFKISIFDGDNEWKPKLLEFFLSKFKGNNSAEKLINSNQIRNCPGYTHDTSIYQISEPISIQNVN